MSRKDRTPSAEHGAALVEFATLMGIVLPIAFGITMLGKLTDLNQTSEQASRYATWETTVYTRAQLANQQADVITKRFFGAPHLSLHTNAQSEQSESDNPLWGMSTAAESGIRDLGKVSRLTGQPASIRYDYDTGKAEFAAAAGLAAASVGSALDGFSGNSWGLVADGMLHSTVSLPLRATSFLHATVQPCGQLMTASPASAQSDVSEFACVSSAGAILADGWSASGDAQAASRIRSLVPMSTLEPIANAVAPLAGIVFPELGSLDGAFGHVDMNVLPSYAKE